MAMYPDHRPYCGLVAIGALFLLILLPGQSTVWAQELPLATTPSWGATSSSGSRALAWGDVDGDGDLDLAGANRSEINLYINESGVLTETPESIPAGPGYANDVAWGDFDGDGDLDLACGCDSYQDYDRPNKVFENLGGYLAADPVWISGANNDTYSVAWGDVDGDGDLDLACGNDGYNTLYLNYEGVLSALPGWTSADWNGTGDLVWGDVDGDGDLDLACGNLLENVLYVNSGGMLSTEPTWSSASAMNTPSIAWGDVDGDGDLDLACGNDGGSTGIANTVYENVEGTLSVDPVWFSETENETRSVAWADVDGDGDLDLACGNVDFNNAVYVNSGGSLQTIPGWTSDSGNFTRSMAWGDVDGDGDLDLACGDSSQGNVIYLNERDAFSSFPGWAANNTYFTYDVAWCDVDGDGDLDLSCGNVGQANTIHMNEGGAVLTWPGWSSGPSNGTYSIDWGDVDGDGDTDLVCGNDSRNTLYENVDGNVLTEPVWVSELYNTTYSVAWGDVDGDGDLDLACGNSGSQSDGERNTLYENVGGVLSESPIWSSLPSNVTHSLAWGDVDGDGDLDLVCGNTFGRNTLYENIGGVLSETPTWYSLLTSTTESVAWGDIDADGDIDLVCGNGQEANAIYFNESGTLSSTPGWTSITSSRTYRVVCEDIDGDGDFDLVCGNDREDSIYINDDGTLSRSEGWTSVSPNTTYGLSLGDVDGDGDLDLACAHGITTNNLHFSKRYPVYTGDFTAPTNHMPNNGTQIRDVRLSPASDNTRIVEFTAFDVESDSLLVVPQYWIEGDILWHSADVDSGESAVAAASSPDGSTGSFLWNIERIPASLDDFVLRLRIVERPGSTGLIRHAGAYVKNVGPLIPRRALLSANQRLSFGPVTVGDTTTASLYLINTGTDLLQVTDIALPSEELAMDTVLPITLHPGDRDTVEVAFMPRSGEQLAGTVSLTSNDLLSPVQGVPVSSAVLALDFDWTLLSTADELPLGEAVTYLLHPEDGVRIESGNVWHRPAGRTSSFAASSFEQLAGQFISSIPGEGVSESGLEYYVEVENSGVYATDPPGAPADSVFSHAVAAPAGVTTTPIPNSSGGFRQDQSIVIQTKVPLGSEFIEGSLRFRGGGEHDFQAVPLGGSTPALTASIPPDEVGSRGLEYYVEVQTLSTTLTDPQVSPASDPRTISVTVVNLEETGDHPGSVFRMISMPLSFGIDVARNWENLLSSRSAFGPYDPARWRVFRYDPAGSDYVELVPDSDAELFRLAPGRAYWLICSEEHRIGNGPVSGFSTPTDRPFEIALAPGWNQISNPFCFPVAWDSVLVGGLPPAETDTLCDGPIHLDPELLEYGNPVPILEPFDGYWVRNNQEEDLLLQIPSREAPLDGAETRAKDTSRGWAVTIGAQTAVASDNCNTVGVHPAALPWFDRFDRAEAPMNPGQAIALYFPHHDWRRHPGYYTTDYRPESAVKSGPGGHAFHFDVAKNYTHETGNQVTLTFSGLENVPPTMEIALADRKLGQTVDLRTTPTYEFPLGSREPVPQAENTRFVLLVGDVDFVNGGSTLPPKRTALFQNYPNPFNPSTVVRFDVAEPCHAQLRIYDVSGALVRTLLDGHTEPGGYEMPWYGRDDTGRRLASGVYFTRLTTDGGYTETRKLVMVQ